MITVNLTTTCQRLPLCKITLMSLCLQSRQADEIRLWVSSEPYLRDGGIPEREELHHYFHDLPAEWRRRIKVCWVTNTGPYRKLIPALREAGPDDLLITADDDIIYGENWLGTLLQAHEPGSNVAIAGRVRQKRYNAFGRTMSYMNWDILRDPSVISEAYIITFGGGAVLSRPMFREQDILDDAFLEIAPTADDLWYSKLLLRNDTLVRVVPGVLRELNFIEHKDGLVNHNHPRQAALLKKLALRLWEWGAGYMGVPVCGNDRAYQSVEQYFRNLSEQRVVPGQTV
ncbi:hypothetical protein [Marinobacter zhanjiangensis]|uniref:Glycosyl transferase family 2 n=1 Tax=Marinobacter zhanjiangensis TaxID=578215 RepID=A0ABQ3AWU4_9GAMM|nr:hypothetical protein [Marinobacter zhanjiangensis]GGY69820.1 glycosyl transferase family 2 [Marinobacter zhanjiangensis]